MELNDNEGGKSRNMLLERKDCGGCQPKNPVDVISKDDLRAIFTGNISNWKELGGPDAPINVVVREDGSEPGKHSMICIENRQGCGCHCPDFQ